MKLPITYTTHRFKVKLKHDGGTVSITTTASDLDSAVRIVCQAECAPVSAVQSVALQGEAIRKEAL